MGQKRAPGSNYDLSRYTSESAESLNSLLENWNHVRRLIFLPASAPVLISEGKNDFHAGFRQCR